MQPEPREGSSQLPDGEDFIEKGAFQLGFEGCTGVYQEKRGKAQGTAFSVQNMWFIWEMGERLGGISVRLSMVKWPSGQKEG